jgi:VWFA-related protein
LVVVDVLVSRNGRPVTGLTRDDFDLRDEGVAQEVMATTVSGGVHVVLVLDVSGSVAGERLSNLKAASLALLGAVQAGDTASLLSFSARLDLLVDASADPQNVNRALDRLSSNGRTSLLDALYASVHLPDPRSRSLVIMFSDGGENASWLSKTDVLESVKRTNAVVYAVTEPADQARGGVALLQEIVDSSGGVLLRAKADQALGGVFVNVLNEFRQRYVLTYTPTGVTQGDGWHRVSVQLKRQRGRIVARPGYYSRPTVPKLANAQTIAY